MQTESLKPDDSPRLQTRFYPPGFLRWFFIINEKKVHIRSYARRKARLFQIYRFFIDMFILLHVYVNLL